jgi:uracil-DNA glycosylase
LASKILIFCNRQALPIEELSNRCKSVFLNSVNGRLRLIFVHISLPLSFESMDVKISPSWKKRLAEEFDKPYFTNLIDFVKSEYQTQTIYPPGKEIFRAFDCCDFDEVKVVIIGQDPYHGAAQANGLCFAVRDGIRLPPSLVNIFKEIEKDLGKPIPQSGDLERWARQGVLLLNATLTVRASSAGSHQNKGWEQFTDAVIQTISEEKENVVFILWGAYAQKKGQVIDRAKHFVLMSPHPSPFSAFSGFFGCKHFSKTNAYLKGKGMKEIDW